MKATPEDVAKRELDTEHRIRLDTASMKATPEDVAKKALIGRPASAGTRLNEGHARRRGEDRGRED